MIKSDFVHSFLFLISLFLFVFLAGYNLNLPGLHYDDSYNASIALSMIQNRPVRVPWSVSLFGRKWPIIQNTHYSALHSYLLAALFLLCGISIYTVRCMNILLSVGSILFTYKFFLNSHL